MNAETWVVKDKQTGEVVKKVVLDPREAQWNAQQIQRLKRDYPAERYSVERK